MTALCPDAREGVASFDCKLAVIPVAADADSRGDSRIG